MPATLRLLLAAGLGFAGFCPLAAAQQPVETDRRVIVRAGLYPVNEAVIGQQVRLQIDVLFPGEMPFPPRVTLPVVSGAQVLSFQTQALTLSERIDGVGYIGKRFEFAVYPLRGGELAIPPTAITLLDRAENETGTTASPALRLRVVVPPGIDASLPVVSSPRVTMNEEWAPAPTSAFKVGDALQRTITRRADDVLGLALSPFGPAAPDGVRAYVDPPQIDDTIQHGAVTGRRIDRLTYFFEAAGRYAIPKLTQQWWDLGSAIARTVELPARSFDVAAAPRTERAIGPDINRTSWLLAIGAAATTAISLWRLLPWLHRKRGACERATCAQ